MRTTLFWFSIMCIMLVYVNKVSQEFKDFSILTLKKFQFEEVGVGFPDGGVGFTRKFYTPEGRIFSGGEDLLLYRDILFILPSNSYANLVHVIYYYVINIIRCYL